VDVEGLIIEAKAGNRRALARLLTSIESGDDEASSIASLAADGSPPFVLGITGAPGVGKSCLVDRIATAWANRGRIVTVLCVDPSSNISGGALLGDRMRMEEASGNGSIHIRSIATRGASGGVPVRIGSMLDALAAVGRTHVLLETAGVGQTEQRIAAFADRLVLVEGPNRGDIVQAEKAGVIEMADVIVVNKSDLEGAMAAAEALRSAESMAASPVGVHMVSSLTGDGVESLLEVLDGLPQRESARLPRARLALLAAAESDLLSNPRIDALIEALASGSITASEAARNLRWISDDD